MRPRQGNPKQGAQGRQHGEQGRRDAALSLAVEALTFLAAEPERIGGFLAEAGIGPQDLRDAAQEPEFLSGVLDHLANDEALLLAFAEHAQIKPDAIGRARAALGSAWERDLP